MEKTKKAKILSFIAFGLVLVFLVGATYAFFDKQAEGDLINPVNAFTAGTDTLSFEIGEPINIIASKDNFGEGGSDLHDSITAKAIATAGTDHVMQERYNVYFLIAGNEYSYNTDNLTPELILTVTDPDGDILTQAEGLEYVEVLDDDNNLVYAGFDITKTGQGAYLLAKDFPITTTDSETHEWDVEVTYVNLDADQWKNTGKKLSASVAITKTTENVSDLPYVNTIRWSFNNDELTITPANTSNNIDKYYYKLTPVGGGAAGNSGAQQLKGVVPNYKATLLSTKGYTNRLAALTTEDGYIETDDLSYTFSGITAGESYDISIYSVDKSGFISPKYEDRIKIQNCGTFVNNVSANYNAEGGGYIYIWVDAMSSCNMMQYLFSIDGGPWVPQTWSSYYLYDDYSTTSIHTVRVKVVDGNNDESPVYYRTFTAQNWRTPELQSVTILPTSGDTNVDFDIYAFVPDYSGPMDYFYSVDGRTFEKSENSSISITGLTYGEQYTFRFYAKCGEGYSEVVKKTVTVGSYDTVIYKAVQTSKGSNSAYGYLDVEHGTDGLNCVYYSVDGGNNYKNYGCGYNSGNAYFSIFDLKGNSATTVYFYMGNNVNNQATNHSNIVSIELETGYQSPSNMSLTVNEVTETSIKVRLNMTGGSSDGTYYYSINNGAYIPSDDIFYKFENLNSGTEYIIKAYYAEGETELEAVSISATTIYVNPEATEITAGSISNSSVTLQLSVNTGSRAIDKYYYSYDDGKSYVETSSTTHVFSNLSDGITYNIKAFAVDTDGYASEVLTATATTGGTPQFTLNSTYNSETDYTYVPGRTVNLLCSGANAEFNSKYNRLEISSLSNTNSNCNINYGDPSDKDYLNQKVIDLVDATREQTDWKVVNKVFENVVDTSGIRNIEKVDKKELLNYVNDKTFPYEYNSETKTWKSTNAYGVDNSRNTRSSISFNLPAGTYQLCYTQDAYTYYSHSTIYMNGEVLVDLTSNIMEGCHDLIDITENDKFRIVFYKGNGDYYYYKDTISFYINRGTYVEDVVRTNHATGYRYVGSNPDNYVWFNNELWRIVGVLSDVNHGITGKQLTKIVRNTSIGTMGVEGDNDGWYFTAYSWQNPSRNNVNVLLNDYYYLSLNANDARECYLNGLKKTCDYTTSGIKKEYRGMISDAYWYTGGYSGTVKDYYNIEYQILEEHEYPRAMSKIGLISASDYGLSMFENEECNIDIPTTGYVFMGCSARTWLSVYGMQWLINNNMQLSTSFSRYTQSVRYAEATPTVYLKEDVYVASGTGTKTDPYILGM